MKIFLAILACLIVAAQAFAADALVSPNVIEGGDRLPSPYDCIRYDGRTKSGIQLSRVGCVGKDDGQEYKMPNAANEFPFLTEGELLILKPVPHRPNEMLLYRRTQ